MSNPTGNAIRAAAESDEQCVKEQYPEAVAERMFCGTPMLIWSGGIGKRGTCLGRHGMGDEALAWADAATKLGRRLEPNPDAEARSEEWWRSRAALEGECVIAAGLPRFWCPTCIAYMPISDGGCCNCRTKPPAQPKPDAEVKCKNCGLEVYFGIYHDLEPSATNTSKWRHKRTGYSACVTQELEGGGLYYGVGGGNAEPAQPKPDATDEAKRPRRDMSDAGPFCKDGGTCHHTCEAGDCFRQRACVPLTISGLNDDWSAPRNSGLEDTMDISLLAGKWDCHAAVHRACIDGAGNEYKRQHEGLADAYTNAADDLRAALARFRALGGE